MIEINGEKAYTTKLMLYVRTEEMWANYAEELADVQIMLYQLIYLSHKEREVEEIIQKKSSGRSS